MKTIRVAALQLAAHNRRDFADAWAHIVPIVEKAAQNARLVVLPEGTAPAYILGDQTDDGTATMQALADLGKIAQSTGATIVVGAVRHDGPNAYNSAYVLDNDGTLAGVADKFTLWHFDQRWFTRGEQIEPISTSIGSLGVMVCADGRVPAIARRLVARGAQILIMPTAWVTSGRDDQVLENLQADLLAQTRARENAVPFVAANKCGTEARLAKYCGKSQIIDHRGTRLAMASQNDPQTLYADVTLAPMHHQPTRAFPVRDAEGISSYAPFRLAVHLGDQNDLGIACAMVDADACVSTLHVPAERNPRLRIRLVEIDDAIAQDPLGLVAHRLAGTTLAIWRSEATERDIAIAIARSRAAELRMYVVLLWKNQRGWIIDPNGTIVCGADAENPIAVANLTPETSCSGMVVPHTDVLNELARVIALDDGDTLP